MKIKLKKKDVAVVLASLLKAAEATPDAKVKANIERIMERVGRPILLEAGLADPKPKKKPKTKKAKAKTNGAAVSS